MTALPGSGYLSNSGRTQQQMKDAFEDLRDFVAEGAGAGPVSALTIAAGNVTPTSARHTVDTEAAASTDDLANILLTNIEDGRWLILEPADGSRLVVVKHLAGGDGQIETLAGHDILLQNRSRLILERSGLRWRQLVETLLPGGPTGASSDFWGDETDIYPRSVLMYGQTLDAAENPDLAARCPGLVSGSDILVPDARERVIVGKNSDSSPTSRIDSGYLDTSSVGNTGGADDVTLADAQVPLREHYHTADGTLEVENHRHYISLNLSISNAGGHNHKPRDLVTGGAASGGGPRVTGWKSESVQSGPNTSTDGVHDHNGSVSGNSNYSGTLDVTGNTSSASLAASVPVALLQPSIVACKILWL
ncbi:hypothetical protein [Methyloceanibacter caenitepidi]|uniref:Uncharacterized protein n=1 Tax=Methyloceanibacter caenitepidi TaxID=1384459 RepID=A0A0A8K8I1_9HYPH|nr:hypothetical protein [Methyloceanibacter caenitepidi]BAQ18294.1 hypothetical protein GL4_2861 [Methyloceanibacter caenitepidi]